MTADVHVHEFWRDTKSDDVWAVELADGEPVACAGPLALGTAELDGDLLDELEYSNEKVAVLRRRRARLRPWEPEHVEIWPT